MENIIIDQDHDIGYETNGKLRAFFNSFLIPVLNSLPSGMREIVKKTNKPAKEIIETASSHHALEILYKYGEPHQVRNIFQQFFHYIWFSTNNPKAVRNRLRLVERELSIAIRSSIARCDGVSILSVASGSARAVIESLDKPEFLTQKINVIFLDKNKYALSYSKKLTEEHDFPNNYTFQWAEDLAGSFHKYYIERDKPNIIETVGLMDYFNDRQVFKFFSQVYKHMRVGGVFITANITDNPERRFVTNLVGWKMIYREPNDFYEIALRAGFKKENIKIIIEPLMVHFVMIARK